MQATESQLPNPGDQFQLYFLMEQDRISAGGLFSTSHSSSSPFKTTRKQEEITSRATAVIFPPVASAVQNQSSILSNKSPAVRYNVRMPWATPSCCLWAWAAYKETSSFVVASENFSEVFTNHRKPWHHSNSTSPHTKFPNIQLFQAITEPYE